VKTKRRSQFYSVARISLKQFIT